VYSIGLVTVNVQPTYHVPTNNMQSHLRLFALYPYDTDAEALPSFPRYAVSGIYGDSILADLIPTSNVRDEYYPFVRQASRTERRTG